MTKRIISVLLALVLVLALSTSALAGTISINGLKDQTYHAWKILDISVVAGQEEDGPITYVVTDAWKPFFENNKEFIVVDEAGNAKLKDGVDTANNSDAAINFTKAALAYAEEHFPDGDAKVTAPADGKVEMTVETAGYYLVDSSVGSLIMMETNYGTLDLTDKNQLSDVDKIITNSNITTADNKENTAKIGDVVNYKTTITAEKGLVTLTLFDTMEVGLTYNKDLTIAGLTKDVQYTVTKSDDDGFTVVFDEEYLDALTEDTQIVVTYTATVNENAEIHENSNDNTTWITFGPSSKFESTHKTTKTWVYELDVFKYTGDDADPTPLAGAEFTLALEGEKLKFIVVDGEYVVSDNAEGTVTNLVSDANGQIKVVGLRGDEDYVLSEKVAPKGYNKLTEDVEFHIDLEGNISGDEADANVIKVKNNTGTTLPSTGGIGTTIFYLVGGLMMAAAVVLLVAKKRTVNE